MCASFVLAGLQPRNRKRLLCAPDGKSHGEGIREKGEWQKGVNHLSGQRWGAVSSESTGRALEKQPHHIMLSRAFTIDQADADHVNIC